MAKKGELTPKQALFVKYYLINPNGREAASKAGYKGNNKTLTEVAVQNLSKLVIKKAIAAQTGERLKTLDISADWVLQSLKDVATRCMQLEPVFITDDMGNKVESGEYKFEHAGANRSLELIGKHLKLFTENLNVGVNDETRSDIRNLMDAINNAGITRNIKK